MKKTVKMLSVLALMLAIIVSCAPGPEATNNGSGTGVINPNIPPATKDDVDTILQIDPSGNPNFSKNKLMVNASPEVQQAFTDKVITMMEADKSKVETTVENGTFIIKYDDRESSESSIMYLKQNGADGLWIEEAHYFLNEEEKIIVMAMSKQDINKDVIVEIKLPDESKLVASYYSSIKGKPTFEAKNSYSVTKAEYKQYCTDNKFTPEGAHYIYANKEKTIYATFYYNENNPSTEADNYMVVTYSNAALR